MATGESITPSADITMQSSSPTAPAIGASIDPTNYYGQSFVYDEWVKAKIKELNQPAGSDVDKALKQVQAQQAEYDTIATSKEQDFKDKLEGIDKIVNAKIDTFRNENKAALVNPVDAFKAEQARAEERDRVVRMIENDPDVNRARGYDPDAGRRYGDIKLYDAAPLKVIQQKYPQYVDLIKNLEPKYGSGGNGIMTRGLSAAQPFEEDDPWVSRLGLSIGANYGNVATPANQLETYNKNIQAQKSAATDAIKEMREAKNKDAFDAAQKRYDNAISSLKETAKTDISKIQVWSDQKFAQGYGVGGRLGADVYGDLANQKYNIETSLSNQLNSANALGNALSKITASGGNINADQILDLQNMKNQVVSKTGELNLVNASIDFSKALSNFYDKPSSENLKIAQTMKDRVNTAQIKYETSQGRIERPEKSGGFLSGGFGKNVIGMSDNLNIMLGNKGTINKDAVSVGKIGGSEIYGTSRGEAVSSITGDAVPLSTVTDIRQEQHQTGEYTPYGVYEISKLFPSLSDSQKKYYLEQGVPLPSVVGRSTEDYANIKSEVAALKLSNILKNPDIIDKYAGAKLSMGKEKTPEGLPIVRYNQSDYVIPATGSPVRLSTYTSLPESEKLVMTKTIAENLLPPDAPQSAIDILNVSAKYGGSSQLNYPMVKNRLLNILSTNKSYFDGIDKSTMDPLDYDKTIDIFGKGLVTGKIDNDALVGIGNRMVVRDIMTAKQPYKSQVPQIPNINTNIDAFGNSTTFNNKKNDKSTPASTLTSTSLINNATSIVKVGSPSKTGLDSALVRVGNISDNVKKPSSGGFDFGNFFGLKKKKEGSDVARKSKSSKPNIDVKTKDTIKMNTKIKSEIPSIDIPELKFIRGKVSNSRVGVIDTEFIGIKNMFKMPKITVGNKKKKVK